MRGSIHSVHIAQLLIGLRVDFPFKGQGTFTGEVIGFDAKEEFGNRLLHIVKFSDGECDEYPYEKIIKAHENYLKAHCAQTPRNYISLSAGAFLASPVLPALYHTPTIDPLPYDLPLPTSFPTYPIRVPVGGQIVQGKITERRVTADGLHEWRVSSGDVD